MDVLGLLVNFDDFLPLCLEDRRNGILPSYDVEAMWVLILWRNDLSLEKFALERGGSSDA